MSWSKGSDAGTSSVSVPPITDGSRTTALRTMNWVLLVRIPVITRSSAAECSPGNSAPTEFCTTRR